MNKTYSTRGFFDFVKAQPDDRPVRPSEPHKNHGDKIGCFLVHFAEHENIPFSSVSTATIFEPASNSFIKPDEDKDLVQAFTSRGFFGINGPKPTTYGEAKPFIPEKYK